MSDRWWEKRRKKKHPWFNVFREFDRIEEMMDEMMRRAFRPFETPKKRRPHVYGFSISVGPNGKPKIRRFGNVQKGRKGPRIREERKPLVDVLDEEEEVVVVAELPGVKKEDINLQASKKALTIRVDTPQRKYHKDLSLPQEVNPKKIKTSYKNGVLEVRFKKKDEGQKIHVR